MNSAQGSPTDIGGYYRPDAEKTTRAMRPSAIFNSIIDAL
jgi:isocitrate dehydrogenase